MNFEIFDSYGQDGSLIFKAGTTCYRSEEKTKRDKDDFIRMFHKNGHTAMLEFSWFPIVITSKYNRVDHANKDINEVYNFFSRQKYFEVSRINNSPKDFTAKIEDEEPDYLIVSANGRAWCELVQNPVFSDIVEDCMYSIFNYLYKINSVLFSVYGIYLEYHDDEYTFNEYFNIRQAGKTVFLFPFSEIHNWVMVKFSGVSRGYTHELVRSRVMSFAQASTRYIDNSNFNVVLPNQYISISEELIPEVIEHNNKTKELYQKLIDNGWRKQDARQILPIGIANEICVAGRIKDWIDIFNLRIANNAHWEIRNIMFEVREEFKRRNLI